MSDIHVNDYVRFDRIIKRKEVRIKGVMRTVEVEDQIQGGGGSF